MEVQREKRKRQGDEEGRGGDAALASGSTSNGTVLKGKRKRDEGDLGDQHERCVAMVRRIGGVEMWVNDDMEDKDFAWDDLNNEELDAAEVRSAIGGSRVLEEGEGVHQGSAGRLLERYRKGPDGSEVDRHEQGDGREEELQVPTGCPRLQAEERRQGGLVRGDASAGG